MKIIRGPVLHPSAFMIRSRCVIGDLERMGVGSVPTLNSKPRSSLTVTNQRQLNVTYSIDDIARIKHVSHRLLN